MQPETKTKSFTLLPTAPGTCSECATAHDPAMPHNQWSLYYQMKFHMAHGRSPTWDDAMSHCTDEMRTAWKAELDRTQAELAMKARK